MIAGAGGASSALLLAQLLQQAQQAGSAPQAWAQGGLGELEHVAAGRGALRVQLELVEAKLAERTDTAEPRAQAAAPQGGQLRTELEHVAAGRGARRVQLELVEAKLAERTDTAEPRAQAAAPQEEQLRTELGARTAVPPAAPPALAVAPPASAALKRGQRVLVWRAPGATGHPWLIPAAPRAIAGTITSVRRGTRAARVRWATCAPGLELRPGTTETGDAPSDVTLPVGRCVGRTGSAGATADAGDWAFYDGPELGGGAVLERIVAVQDATQPETGRTDTLMRVRQLGVDVQWDRHVTEHELRERWPDQAVQLADEFRLNKRDLPDQE